MHPHAGSATGVAIADARGAIDHARMLANMVFAVKLLGEKNGFFAGQGEYPKVCADIRLARAGFPVHKKYWQAKLLCLPDLVSVRLALASDRAQLDITK
jgi:hypothetical protein